MTVTMTSNGHVVTLQLNRPESLNALGPSMAMELNAHLDKIEGAEGSVGCIVLHGAGRAFSAGYDVKNGQAEREEMEARGISVRETLIAETIERLSHIPAPVVAAVHGYCITGGLELALAADIIVAADDSVFRDTHGKIGLNAAWGLSQRLPRRVGLGAAKLLMLSARRIDAAEALRIGLVQAVVAREQLLEYVERLAEDIAANNCASNRRTKYLINRALDLTLEEGLELELETHPRAAAMLPVWRARSKLAR